MRSASSPIRSLVENSQVGEENSYGKHSVRNNEPSCIPKEFWTGCLRIFSHEGRKFPEMKVSKLHARKD